MRRVFLKCLSVPRSLPTPQRSIIFLIAETFDERFDKNAELVLESLCKSIDFACCALSTNINGPDLLRECKALPKTQEDPNCFKELDLDEVLCLQLSRFAGDFKISTLVKVLKPDQSFPFSERLAFKRVFENFKLSAPLVSFSSPSGVQN